LSLKLIITYYIIFVYWILNIDKLNGDEILL